MKNYISEIYKLGIKLFPICRSITGNGVRQTLAIIKKQLPKLKITEVKSGTKVFDWTIPPEWNIKDAFVKDQIGKKIIDFKKNNLHIVNYSIPIKRKINKKELFEHLHTSKKLKNAIPYVTSYYRKYWGFCITYNEKRKLEKKFKKLSNKKNYFQIEINSSINKKGSLTYGEFFVPGRSKKEILISTYICHPSMANNELSGPLVATALAKKFSKEKNEFGLRFIFVPETIGAVAYIKKNLKDLKKNVFAGYSITRIGDERTYSFLPTKYENTISDRVALKAFKDLNLKYDRYNFFSHRGSDERQFNSPGVDIPMACVMRSRSYPEYHTSFDNFKLVTKKGLEGGFKLMENIIFILMNNYKPKAKYLCEPQMGKRNLYSMWGQDKSWNYSKYLMNFLQYSDGKKDLIDISEIMKIDFTKTLEIYKTLKKNKLLK